MDTDTVTEQMVLCSALRGKLFKPGTAALYRRLNGSNTALYSARPFRSPHGEKDEIF